MKQLAIVAALSALALAGCNRNTAIGNDREADRDPPSHAAPIRPAGTALQNVSTALVKPETMSDADVAAIGGTGGRCVFTLTEVSFPAFVYAPGDRGFIKLNGTLVPLDAVGADRFENGGLVVTTRLLDTRGNAGLRGLEMIVVPPGARDELGYRGYTSCDG
ncbi:DUF6692 family protein [Croceicoccus hydrothermalis]|uniref:DUF6692 family protein n=1 Tax=Croceicoccus hydrothermalis TaxID=2867964 RepID=UPI001EFA8168|nr:DUF6692 family protein [Croceicoccus hydrothermalis]